MSHLSLLRQRIKAIKTIRKTMGAMRLAARSIQSRLKKKEQLFQKYIAAIEMVYTRYRELNQDLLPDLTPPRAHNIPSKVDPLIILVGSDKGLCGAFNDKLCKFFSQYLLTHPSQRIMAVGAQVGAFLVQKNITPLRQITPFNSASLIEIAHMLTHAIIKGKENKCVIISNISRTFFLQQPRIQEVPVSSIDTALPLENHLILLRLQSNILQTLYESLLAEQTARFLSMDNATKNADDILAKTVLEYNKLRQAQVTQELLELTSGYTAENASL